jgi:hypothetical protein
MTMLERVVSVNLSSYEWPEIIQNFGINLIQLRYRAQTSS